MGEVHGKEGRTRVTTNGHQNGHYANGQELADEICTIHPGSGTQTIVKNIIRTMDDAHARQIPLDPKLVEAVPIVVARLMQHDSPRYQAAGAKLAVAALKHNLERFALADKLARLEEDKPTERVEQRHFVVPPPRVLD